MSMLGFRKELESLINSQSRENGSNTPDWILADYLVACLQTFDNTVNARERWYSREPSLIVEPAPTVHELEGMLADNGDEEIKINPDGSISPARRRT